MFTCVWRRMSTSLCGSLATFMMMTLAAVLLLLFSPWCLQAVAAKPYRGRFNVAKCYDLVTKRELLVGDAFTRIGHCVRVQCLGDLNIWEDRCQIPNFGGNCTVIPPANEYLDYPKCCPLYECKTFETNEYGETDETRIYNHYGMLKKTEITKVFVINKSLDGGNVPGTGIRTQFQI